MPSPQGSCVMGAIPWGNIGAGGLVAFAVLLLLTGRLVTDTTAGETVRPVRGRSG